VPSDLFRCKRCVCSSNGCAGCACGRNTCGKCRTGVWASCRIRLWCAGAANPCACTICRTIRTTNICLENTESKPNGEETTVTNWEEGLGAKPRGYDNVTRGRGGGRERERESCGEWKKSLILRRNRKRS